MVYSLHKKLYNKFDKRNFISIKKKIDMILDTMVVEIMTL